MMIGILDNFIRSATVVWLISKFFGMTEKTTLNKKTTTMSKISIIEKFAQDAINAPALVTGGKKCGGSKGKSRKGSKRKSGGGSKAKSRKSGGGKGSCYVPPPCKY